MLCSKSLSKGGLFAGCCSAMASGTGIWTGQRLNGIFETANLCANLLARLAFAIQDTPDRLCPRRTSHIRIEASPQGYVLSFSP